ncbi:MAG TPA: lipopolysaccharide heptosyltransferase I [Gammaproteobacteria bacterium]|nr:lipopolysaccharide heptosyltransferase I [Gammaproteobacteria bacterium]
MRVLIIKTSSMGDVIHTLPALKDAGKFFPGMIFDWAVEENFAEIPRWHPLVKKIIPIALRRWRKNLFSRQTKIECKNFFKELRTEKYDFIIDAQGLLKSAFIARFARGIRCGFDRRSAREPLAAFFYQRQFSISKNQHAVTRVRELFSRVLNYSYTETALDYGIDRTNFYDKKSVDNYFVFLHGTTWDTKHWPEAYWIELATIANQNGFLVKLPWGNITERERAERIATACPHVEVLPRLDLIGIATILAAAKAVVAVDTGLGHLAAALNVPTVSLYGPTNPALIGTLGQSQIHLSATFPCAPCVSRICTYQDTHSPFNPPSPLKFPSPLKPPCFGTVRPSDVWNSVEMLF